MVKTLQFTTKYKIDCWVIDMKQRQSKQSINYNDKTQVLQHLNLSITRFKCKTQSM